MLDKLKEFQKDAEKLGRDKSSLDEFKLWLEADKKKAKHTIADTILDRMFDYYGEHPLEAVDELIKIKTKEVNAMSPEELQEELEAWGGEQHEGSRKIANEVFNVESEKANLDDLDEAINEGDGEAVNDSLNQLQELAMLVEDWRQEWHEGSVKQGAKYKATVNSAHGTGVAKIYEGTNVNEEDVVDVFIEFSETYRAGELDTNLDSVKNTVKAYLDRMEVDFQDMETALTGEAGR